MADSKERGKAIDGIALLLWVSAALSAALGCAAWEALRTLHGS